MCRCREYSTGERSACRTQFYGTQLSVSPHIPYMEELHLMKSTNSNPAPWRWREQRGAFQSQINNLSKAHQLHPEVDLRQMYFPLSKTQIGSVTLELGRLSTHRNKINSPTGRHAMIHYKHLLHRWQCAMSPSK